MSEPELQNGPSIAQRLADVRSRIDSAARRCDRQAEDITLLGASKYQSPEIVAASLRAGLRCVGENYVEETNAKRPVIEKLIADAESAVEPVRWHMIGALQRNKVRLAVTLFDVIETLDRNSLAVELDKRAAAAGRQIDAFVQVNLSRESQKAGIQEEELPALLESCALLQNLRITGLMTIPAASSEPEDSRRDFSRLRELHDGLRNCPGGDSLSELSMGMSKDFEIAIEEGATVVRVGRDLFGERPGTPAPRGPAKEGTSQ
jgi:pyridoxal phosphate enzyme (YggS family)